jgi:iduronate 2-sulfatase
VKAQQYNVLYFVADDLRPEIAKGYDQKAMHTPNIDKMAAGGLVFEKAYCQQAVCGAR